MWDVLFIENTSRCSLLCPGCKRPRTGASDMPMKVFKTALEKMPTEDTRAVSFFWRGEPTLDPRLPKMAQIAKSYGYTTYTSTNTATPLLHDKDYVSRLLSSMDRICFCVDGYDQRTLSIYRQGADWNMLLKNLDVISKTKTKCIKEMRTLMFRYNENHEEKFKELARKYGMHRLFFGRPIVNGKRRLTDEEADFWVAKKKIYRRYAKKGGVWVHMGKPGCNFIPIVSVNGDIASCCYDWNVRHPLGNIMTDSMEKINKNFYRLEHLGKQQKLSMCRTDCFIPNFAVNSKNQLK